jgi:transcriptional regulator with XRE-family HTH domain
MVESTSKVSVRQIKAARALLGWSQDALADAAAVSRPTVKRLESRKGDLGGRPDTIERLRRTLERNGIEFMNGGSPGVRIKPPVPMIATLAPDELNASNDE